MYLRLLLKPALVAAVLAPAGDCLSAILSEGDVQVNGEIRVAEQADGSLTITPPDTLVAEDIRVALQSSLTGAFTIDGSTIEARFSNTIAVGVQGHGTLDIVNGGRLFRPDFRNIQFGIATESGSVGTVRVQGVGAQLDLPGGLASIGSQGVGSLLIENGARAAFQDLGLGGDTFGNGPNGFGATIVRGPGSDLEVFGRLAVGARGIGELRVENGGTVRDGAFGGGGASIGHESFGGSERSGSGLAVVDGAGSSWFQQGGLTVGGSGSGNLSITGGGVVSSGIGLVAGDFNSNPNSNQSGVVTINGLGSQWNVTNLVLGQYGSGQVLLSNGARLINSNSEFFSSSGSSGTNTVFGAEQGSYGRLVVDGPATQWVDNSQTLTIGSRGTGELVIQNSAVVSSDEVLIGSSSGGHGEVTVTGAGSRWQVQSLSIGQQGARGIVTVADGARVQTGLTQGSSEVLQGGELVLDRGTIATVSRGSALVNRGLIRGSGAILNSVSNTDDGNIRVEQSERLLLSGMANNSGRIDLLGGELEVTGIPGLDNAASGVLTMQDATLRVANLPSGPSVRLRNEGDLIVASGTNQVFGNIHNDMGDIILSGNSQTTFFGDVLNEGMLNVSNGSVATFFGDVSGNGIGGEGTVFLEGDVFPGFSPGLMAFGGDVNLGNFSDLNIEIAAESHDALDIVGDATLSGDLVLSALEALSGDLTIEILSAASIEGTFDSVPSLGEELGFGVVFGGITYHADSVEISLLQQTGDFNGDGNVDGIDLADWSLGFGIDENAMLADGDAQRDGDVDGSDFLTWQRNRQAVGASVAASQSVPEATSIVLLILASTIIGTRRL